MSDGRGEPGERPGLGDPADWAPPAGLGRAAEPHPADPQLRPYPAGSPGVPEPSGVFWPPREEYAIRPPAGRDRLWPRQAEIRWAVVVVIVLALLGIAAGGLWIAAAPRLPFQVVKGGQAIRLQAESEVFVADDGWYFLITLAIGLVAGVLAWLPRSGRGWLMPVALAVGGVAGALVTWAFGEWLTPPLTAGALQQVGATVLFQVRLKAQAAVVAEAFAAVVAYLVLAGFASRDDLGNPEPGAGVA
jgi:hypothetical protein